MVSTAVSPRRSRRQARPRRWREVRRALGPPEVNVDEQAKVLTRLLLLNVDGSLFSEMNLKENGSHLYGNPRSRSARNRFPPRFTASSLMSGNRCWSEYAGLRAGADGGCSSRIFHVYIEQASVGFKKSSGRFFVRTRTAGSPF